MCVYVYVYVCETASEHTLRDLFWFHFICNECSPGKRSVITHNNSDQCIPGTVLLVGVLLCFDSVLSVVVVFFLFFFISPNSFM